MECMWKSEDSLKKQFASSTMWVLEDQPQDVGLWEQEALHDEPAHKPGVYVSIHMASLCLSVSVFGVLMLAAAL